MNTTMLETANYLKTLDALSRMRDQCQGELALPQICVVGDQTSGKSSLLQCLTLVPFPVKSGICTRAPVVVQCRRSETALCEIEETVIGDRLQQYWTDYACEATAIAAGQ